MTRWISMSRARWFSRCFRHAAESPLSRGVPVQGAFEFFLVEIRPQRVAEVQLGISQLPQQEVADAALATGADQQIRVRKPGGGQLLLKVSDADGFAGCSQLARRVHDVPLAAVTHGDEQRRAF